MKHRVRHALQGLNYLVMIEFEVFGNRWYHEEWTDDDGFNVNVPRGRLIAPHIQGLLWGQRPSRRQRAQFAGGILNAPSIKLMPLRNFAGAVHGQTPLHGPGVTRSTRRQPSPLSMGCHAAQAAPSAVLSGMAAHG